MIPKQKFYRPIPQPPTDKERLEKRILHDSKALEKTQTLKRRAKLSLRIQQMKARLKELNEKPTITIIDKPAVISE